ncbi:MAG: hypothetical protein ABJF10_21810, partial [Chthoniobacter sp.]
MEEEVVERGEAARRGETFWVLRVERLRGVEVGVGAVEDELVDGLLAEVFGDFRAGVVGAEFLLVDVFLEDVAE